MNKDTERTRLIITTGEPAGIGPDLLIQQVQQCHLDAVVLADPELLAARARLLGCPITLIEYRAGQTLAATEPQQLVVLPIPMQAAAQPGQLAPANAGYVLKMLDTACDLCLGHHFDAMVTAPLSKSVINRAGLYFTGQTEYLATRCRTDTAPVMLLTSPQLKVALVTTHMPLHIVHRHITAARLQDTLMTIKHTFPRYFGIDDPTILVCGLNPHAGEEGYLGDEEQRIIKPVIAKLKKTGFKLHGPVSADTAFSEENRAQFDVFVCMYHDQGLPVLKTLSFGAAVNVSLGLPIIRTSVDHGTALALAGSGKTSTTSLQAAIDMATAMARCAKNSSSGSPIAK